VVFRYDPPLFLWGCRLPVVAAVLGGLAVAQIWFLRRRFKPVAAARQVVPWIVAFGLLAVLLRNAGIAQVRGALHEANLPWLLGATVLCTLPMYLLDIFALARVFTWFNVPITMREMAPVKAAVYLINIVNYNAGSGAVALWVNRRRRVPFLEAAASVLFVNLVDVSVLVAFMAAGLPALDPPVDRGVLTVVIATLLALTAHFLYWRRGIDFLLLERFRDWPIFKSFREAPTARYLRLAAIRAPFDFFFILNYWLALRAFDIDVPFVKSLAYVPVITLVGILPITVAGLGTVQAATVYLFAAYAPQAKILAFSLAFTVVLMGVRALIGVPVFRKVSGEMLTRAGESAQ
jgi:uncharacterized membrane protein YbhN (UPF0104 family)